MAGGGGWGGMGTADQVEAVADLKFWTPPRSNFLFSFFNQFSANSVQIIGWRPPGKSWNHRSKVSLC